MRFRRIFMSLLDFSLSARRRGRWRATFLLAALLAVSTLAYAPQTSAPQVRVQSRSLAAADEVEFMGVWPYGPCQAAAIDPARNIALIGNGETLQVLDISNPSSLSMIGEARLEGNPQGIVVAGNYAYVVTLSYFIVVDLADPKIPREVASVFLSIGNMRSLALSANHVYLASVGGLLIFDVSNPRQPVYRAHYDHDKINVTDVAVWGSYALCLAEYYKLPGDQQTTYGVEMIDVSLPTAPTLAGRLDLGKDYMPRDIDVSAAGYAYVCQSAERNNAGRLTVVDVATDPQKPSEVGRYATTGNGMAGIALAGNYAYLLLNWPRRLTVLNISSPQAPLLIGDVAVDNLGKMVISANLLGVSEGGSGFSLYSVTNPVQPFRLANYDTPDTMTGRANSIVARGDYVYMGCASDGLRIMDVSTPSDPREASVCNDRSLRGKVAVLGEYAYGLDSDRLSVYDISSPRSPSRLADLALPCPEPASDSCDYWGLAVRMPYAYVSGTNWGLTPTRAIILVIDVSDPFTPRLVSSLYCAHKSVVVGSPALSGNYLYLGLHDFSQGDNDCRSGIWVVDVSDPRYPRDVATGISNLSGYGVNVVVRGNYAYSTGDMLRIFDLSNPASPSLLVSYVLRCEGIALSGDYVYLDWDKLWIIDISDIYHPTGVFVRGESAKGVAVSGNIAYVPGSLFIIKNKMAPDVAITSPTGESTLLGSVFIEVQASHSSGIDRVEFYVDDSFNASDTVAPYSYLWDTRPYEDGLHTIRVRAYNKNGKSSDVEREVFTRLVYAPQSFAGEKVLNRSLSQAEYINALSWRANPSNVNVVKYSLYLVEGRNRTLVAELGADTFQYWHRRIEKDKEYAYALIAVNNAGRESDPVSVTVK
jgi:hypothetical protein